MSELSLILMQYRWSVLILDWTEYAPPSSSSLEMNVWRFLISAKQKEKVSDLRIINSIPLTIVLLVSLIAPLAPNQSECLVVHVLVLKVITGKFVGLLAHIQGRIGVPQDLVREIKDFISDDPTLMAQI